MTNEQRQTYIKGLLHERHIYEKHGNKDGVAQVDEQLRRLGHEGSTPHKRAEQRPAKRSKAKETR